MPNSHELSHISNQNSTPLDLAIRANQSAIVDLLSLAGAREIWDVRGERARTTPEETLDELRKTRYLVDFYSGPFLEPSTEDDMSRPEKLSLAFDKRFAGSLPFSQFIYPSSFLGRRNTVTISHPLDTSTTSISISLTERRANMVDYPIASEMFLCFLHNRQHHHGLTETRDPGYFIEGNF